MRHRAPGLGEILKILVCADMCMCVLGAGRMTQGSGTREVEWAGQEMEYDNPGKESLL